MRICAPFSPWTLLLCLSCVSCSLQATQGEDRVCVSFGVEMPAPFTKSGLREREFEVQSVDLFVFDALSGERISVARGTSEGLTVLVPARQKLSYLAVLNSNSGFSFDNREQLLSVKAEMSSFSTTSFLMLAQGEATFDRSSEVSLKARRMLCKVMVDSVSLLDDIPHNALLLRSYLINVCGSEPYSMEASDSGPWFNRMALDPVLPSPLREHLVSDSGPVALGRNPSACDIALYCLPNPIDSDLTSREAPEWSPRSTRLVFEVLIDDVIRYYSVKFGNMKSNTCYRIRNLVLNGPGSDDPDDPDGSRAVECEVSVTDWEDGAGEEIGL